MSLSILHVLDHSIPLHSGYAFRTRSIIAAQHALGWRTLHVTSPRQEGATRPVEQVDGLEFHRVLPRGGMLRRMPLGDYLDLVAGTRRKVSDIIDRHCPDIVHAHSPCLVGIAALRAARAARVPFVYELRAFWEDAAVDHGTTTEGSLRYRLSKNMETWLLRRADAITVICEGLKDDVVGRGIPAARVTLIPNAVDVQRFPVLDKADAALKQRLGLADALVLGFIGSFYGYEGLDLLLEALPRLLPAHPRARVLLVGGGYEEERLKAQAARLGIADKVVFTGRVPHEDVQRYYGVVDILVYPRKSMRLTETVTPLKPLEAMAQGRLLAASDVGGHRELIEDGRTGFLFRPDDADALAATVTRMLASPGTWQQVREAGRRFVETERTWAASVARYRGVYSQVLGSAV